jgi:hypothetical protein
MTRASPKNKNKQRIRLPRMPGMRMISVRWNTVPLQLTWFKMARKRARSRQGKSF